LRAIRKLPDLRSLLAAIGALLAVRTARALLPYRACERWLIRLGGRIRGTWMVGAGDPRRIARAVSIAARRLPLRSTCLDRSRAARLLLAAAGKTARMRLGARRIGGGGIEAHAWLEHDGRTIPGEGEGAGFTPFEASRGEGA